MFASPSSSSGKKQEFSCIPQSVRKNEHVLKIGHEICLHIGTDLKGSRKAMFGAGLSGDVLVLGLQTLLRERGFYMGYKVLCVDDQEDQRLAIRMSLKGYAEVLGVENIQEAKRILLRENIDLVLLDVGLGDESGINGVKLIKSEFPDIDVVMLSGQHDPKIVVEAIHAGASDYLTKPFSSEEFFAVFALVLKNRNLRERYEALVSGQNDFNQDREIIFTGPAFKKVLKQAGQLKGYQANVFVMGETGTGKEYIARYIHQREDDPARPFIAVNCAAIPENLIEAELFGVEKGAYTGALQRRIGRFELADGGDIFLDEIGTLKLDLQAKILRVLQEKEFVRLGGSAATKANFRVIAASNENIEDKVSRGEFRMDLYHRLRVIQLDLPALRDRKEDIPALVAHFFSKHSKQGVTKTIHPQALEKLMEYSWPGNVRELENVVQSLIILSQKNSIQETDLPAWALNGIHVGKNAKVSHFVANFSASSGAPFDQQQSLKEYTQYAEKMYIQEVLGMTKWDKSKAARVLDVGRTTLYSKLKEFNLL